MKNQYIRNIKLEIISLSVIATLLLALVGPAARTAAAGSASLYLTPPTGSVLNGSNIVLSVFENSGGEPVNVVTAAINYEASKFDYVGIDSSGSAFSVAAPDSINAGSLEITRGTTAPVTGAQFVFRLTLRAKVGSGTGAVTINKDNSLVADAATSNNILTSVQNGTYTFTAPTPGATNKPKPSSVSGPTPSNPAVDNTPPPVVKDVGIRPGFNTANFSWETAEPARVTIEYGTSKDLGLSVSSGELTTKQALALDFSNLQAGTTYYYRVKSSDASGNVSISDVQTFKTRGYKIILIVRDSKGKLIKNTKFQLFSEPQDGKTGKDGKASLTDIAPGFHRLVMTVAGKQVEQAIEVKDTLQTEAQAVETGDPKVQELPVSLAVVQKATVPIIAPILLIALLIGAGAYVLIKKRKNQALVYQSPYVPGPIVNDASNPYTPNTYNQPTPTQVIHPEPRDPNNPE